MSKSIQEFPRIPNTSQHIQSLNLGIDTIHPAPGIPEAPSHGRTWAIGTAVLQRCCWPTRLGFLATGKRQLTHPWTGHDSNPSWAGDGWREKRPYWLMGTWLSRLSISAPHVGHFLHFKGLLSLLRRMKAWNTRNWEVRECHRDPLWISLLFPLKQGQPQPLPEVILSKVNDSLFASLDWLELRLLATSNDQQWTMQWGWPWGSPIKKIHSHWNGFPTLYINIIPSGKLT